jgi:hypothetical protein
LSYLGRYRLNCVKELQPKKTKSLKLPREKVERAKLWIPSLSYFGNTQLSKVRKKPAMSAVETSIWTSQRMEHTRKLKAQAPLTQVKKKGTTPIHV